MDLNLQEKNVLVTGGSKGIGKAIAHAFINEGANVTIVGRNIDSLQEVKKELGSRAQFIQTDISQENERIQLVKQFIKDNNSIDVLINNAGGVLGKTALTTEMDDFYKSFELNFFSAVHLSKLASKHMQKQESGSIINITSIFGRESGGGVTYNTAKSALISFTKSMADEAIKSGIRVNSIAPGSVYHETSNWKKRKEKNPEQINHFVQSEIPAGRFGTTEEVANIAVLLASNKTSWIVGASINVDGGQSRMNF